MHNRIIESSTFSYAKSAGRVNQDSFLNSKIVGDGVLFAVADGVGSYKGAEKASSIAIEYLNELTSSNQVLDFDTVFNEIRNSIAALGKENEELYKASTTLTYCYVHNGNVYVAHIGDCRAYIRQGCKLKQLTKDHTQHQFLLDQGVFTKAQLKHAKGKNVITAAISTLIPMEFSNYTFSFEELNVQNSLSIYLMSDGSHHFWEKNPKFSFNTMRSVNRFSSSLHKRIERNGAVDDYTLVGCEIDLSTIA